MGTSEEERSHVDGVDGPPVPAYTITRGRTRSRRYDMLALVAARPNAHPSAIHGHFQPEHLALLGRVAERPLSVAELAAHLRLPMAVVGILVDDLSEKYLVSVTDPSAITHHAQFPRDLLERLHAGIQKL